MAAATAAMHLCARHEECAILRCFDAAFDRLEEAWPASAGLEFRSGLEQFLSAPCATEHARSLFSIERAGSSPFRPVLAQDIKLLWREVAPPFLDGLLNREGFAFGVFGRFAKQGTDAGHESLQSQQDKRLRANEQQARAKS
jgi:hypothetical protein